jgi:hypothetical protein
MSAILAGAAWVLQYQNGDKHIGFINLGSQKLMGENLKVVWAKISIKS